MIFKRLEVGILVRLLGLFALLYAAVYYAHQGSYMPALFLGLLLTALSLELARYVARGNQELASFLLAMKYRDFSQHFNESSAEPSLAKLHAAFNQINGTFRQLSTEKEAQFTYLQTVLALIDTGIISYDTEGQVEWVNESFKQTLALPYLHNIHALPKRHPVLYEAIMQLSPGVPTVVKLAVGQKTMQLLLSATTFKLQNRSFTLIAFKNVSHALDETETEAWQKLLRVMTHEIMNSVAPIASLADTLRHHVRLEKEKATVPLGYDANLLDDVEEGIRIIQHRSEGLLNFAQVYRNFSKITTPLLTTIYVQELFRSIQTLLARQLAEQHVELTVSVQPADLLLQADSRLMEQVLINLVLNAAHAVEGRPQPQIQLVAKTNDTGRILLEVIDNGTGIPTALLDSIFIPFFTTHKHGSGIGLSLAKQIMHLHKGSIQVQSEEGIGSVFRLTF
ncbi:sensor histidine kinase [Hymenobacter sp. GOD-10R]|uniref:sensor histidine kinase n=1 Tax=Hymenobacter sp. GOD-10R TaxID=3093922 RepID=UPI002D77A952|nr:ATP-binding protein [Hymenobacter sp. GOD-10R]WRQ30819.1 ATP-binding protein [Hymenobacter sp. GOD-10R]